MPIDWINGLIGGIIIGTAAAMYLLMSGKVMGASGILGGVIDRTHKKPGNENLIFISGLILFPAFFNFLGVLSSSVTAETYLSGNFILVIIAGLLVGSGTRLAGGCTSGHGVCGISRLSVRGILATLIYILFGILTVVIFKYFTGLN